MLAQENWINGYIAQDLKGGITRGFPYRSLFMIPQFDKLYRDLTEEEHAVVNFRRKNIEALKPQILELLSRA